MMTKQKWINLPLHIFLILGCIVMIAPFLWMVLSSFKTFAESVAIPPILMPKTIPGKVFSGEESFPYLFTNFSFLFSKINTFPQLYFNTLALIAGRIFFAVATSSLAAYAFAKLNFPFKRVLFSIVIVQLMLPSQIFLVPQYKMAVALGLQNTVGGLIFPGVVSAFGVFFMRQFYMSLPNELSEAAIIEGCNHWQIFSRIMFPMTRTAIMALAIFTAVFAWSDLMWPLIINPNNDAATLASILSKINGMTTVFKTPHFMAASTLAMMPMLILYIIFQKQFVDGIAMTGLKA